MRTFPGGCYPHGDVGRFNVADNSVRVTVIGAGVVGCAVGLELRRAGLDVTIVDKHGDVGHGSTSASCGIVRRFYSQPGMIAMAHEAAHIWADWDAYIGPIADDLAVFHRPGMLFIPPGLDDATHATVAEMRRLGIRVSVLSPDDVVDRFPFLDLAKQFPPQPVDNPNFFSESGQRIDGAVFEEDAGYVVFPALAAQNLRRAAEREGARFLLHREVVRIDRTAAGHFALSLRADTSLESDIVVNVSGPHSSITNDLAGVRLPL